MSNFPTYTQTRKVQAAKIKDVIQDPKSEQYFVTFEDDKYDIYSVSKHWVEANLPKGGSYLVIDHWGHISVLPAVLFEAEYVMNGPIAVPHKEDKKNEEDTK